LVIVDTTVWVDYLNGFDTRYTVWLDEQLERQRLGLTDLILCEVLQGIRDDKQAARVREELLEFEILTMGGIALAVTAAQNYRLLRARGRTVRKTIDCLIATFCLLNDHELIHNDRDFDPFEQVLKLQVIHP
jgi:predicted nucleic acid-binding protein